MIAHDLVERAERLVHQQKIRLERKRAAIEARCCMPPDNCQGNLRSKPVRLTSSRFLRDASSRSAWRSP